MAKLCLLLVSIIMAIQNLTLCKAKQSECDGNSGITQNINVSINSKRSKGGEWETRFSAAKNTSVLTEVMDLDLTQAVVECSGHRFINLQGVIKAQNEKRGLLFHKICSANGAITNNGRSFQKFKQNGKATAFTERPLMDDEIFSVRLDKGDNNYPLAIGVTIHAPGSIKIPDQINSIRTGSWSFYNSDLYSNGSVIYEKYMKSTLRELKAGEVVGIMRSKFGVLHLFLNGVDQGPAAPNIPETVYGAFELYDGGLQGTIVDF